MGVHRLPAAGGTPERVYENYTTGGLGLNSWRTADTVYVNDASYLLKFTDSGQARRISSVPATTCTTHTVMPHGGNVYTITFNSSTGENQVWRIKE